mmetsp:Transcript_61627/g.133419  ORF Transcript_61627/g.133419 Transcript_61627/m.133419 type:complete len:451 (+) Transcript_61627:56-1408(+)
MLTSCKASGLSNQAASADAFFPAAALAAAAAAVAAAATAASATGPFAAAAVLAAAAATALLIGIPLPLAVGLGQLAGKKPSKVTTGHWSSGEAQDYWARGYGRYKHCGLRPDPFASEDPPVCSLTPVELPLGELQPGEAERLEELRGLVQDLVDAGDRDSSRQVLLRNLRAEKGVVLAAEKRMRQLIKYRKDHDVDRALTHWNLEAYERCLQPWWLSGGFLGHGLKGEPVALERIGRCDWPRIVRTLPWEDIVKLDIVHCLRCLGAVEEDALRRNRPIGGTILVYDLEGFSMSDIQFHAAMKLTCMQSRGLLLADIVGQLLFIRTPTPFLRAWQLFQHLLDQGTVRKVRMAGVSDTLPLLREYMNDDVIPQYLGGSMCIGGDSECRELVAPGGFPPERAIARFEALKQGRSEVDSSPKAKSLKRGGSDEADGLAWMSDMMCGLTRRRACC